MLSSPVQVKVGAGQVIGMSDNRIQKVLEHSRLPDGKKENRESIAEVERQMNKKNNLEKWKFFFFFLKHLKLYYWITMDGVNLIQKHKNPPNPKENFKISYLSDQQNWEKRLKRQFTLTTIFV